jgi:hypothetical protein
VGKKAVVGVAIKSKLKNLHSGEAEFVAQCFHFTGYDAQILGNDIEWAELLSNLGKEILAWSFKPFAIDCRGTFFWNGPV